jgi:hypothetical protein
MNIVNKEKYKAIEIEFHFKLILAGVDALIVGNNDKKDKIFLYA